MKPIDAVEAAYKNGFNKAKEMLIKKAEWIKHDNPAHSPFDGSSEWIYNCSNCGEKSFYHSKYCPNCGAEMESEQQ